MANFYVIKGVRRFNIEKVAVTAEALFMNGNEDCQLMIRTNRDEQGEVKSYTILTDDLSTQGVNIVYRLNGQIVLELPWLASITDVRYCFSYLQAAKKVHRSARISDEEGKDVRITDEDAMREWFHRCDHMKEILEKGEDMTVKGWHREFHIHPERYSNLESVEDKVKKMYDEFINIQWGCFGYNDLLEERRHVTKEEEVSTIRVIDNTENCFIGDCTFIGLMHDNTCKMVKSIDFYTMMEESDFFHRLDYKQALLDLIPAETWNRIYDNAQGTEIENYRKTFIMRWNTDISSYKMSEFEDSMRNFHDDDFYYDWSIWDYKKVHIGDKFYMIRSGKGVNGIVMKGTITGEPYVDEDWSGKGRKVYYIRLSLGHMIHPERSSMVLTVDELSSVIPGFDWREGHSGEMLSDDMAKQLDNLWDNYLKQVHERLEETEDTREFEKYFQEKKLKKKPYYEHHRDHIATVMRPEEFVEKIAPEIGKWSLYGSASTKVTHNEYIKEKADIIAVRTGEDMGMMALLLDNKKEKRTDFVCTYPMHEGIKHRLHICNVVEWENQIEALVFAETEEMPIAFYATDYYTNKKKYTIGQDLDIELAACGYSVVEGESETVLDEEVSAKFRKDLGIEEEYDENGNLLPIVFCNDELVGYLPHNDKYPDDAEFASPVQSVEDKTLLGIDFIKAIISIAHEPEETYVPLYFRKELLPDVKEGTLLRGFLWMQGRIAE